MRNSKQGEGNQLPVTLAAIRHSIAVARDNWNSWRDVYEHRGSIATNPLLASEHRFSIFCREYSVSRTIRRGTQDQFRLALLKSLSASLRDESGKALDKLENRLRAEFGTRGGERRVVSAVSKVASLVRPECFVAWDRFAKKGVNVTLNRSPRTEFETYSEYLAAFGQIWHGGTGKQIRDVVKASRGRPAPEREARFMRRVLDVLLMKLGGRDI